MGLIRTSLISEYKLSQNVSIYHQSYLMEITRYTHFCWHFWKCNLFPKCLSGILDFMKYCHQPFMIFYMRVLFIALFHVPVSLAGILLLSISGRHSSRIPSILLCNTHPIPKHKYFSSRLAVLFAQSIEARCEVENEDVVGAAPTGDAPTTSGWTTILLPTKVRLIVETLR